MNKNPHYNTSEYEVFRVAEAWGLTRVAYIWTAFKYLGRCLHSGRTIEDLIKARWYIEREIQMRTAEACKDATFEAPPEHKEAWADAAKLNEGLRPSKLTCTVPSNLIDRLPENQPSLKKFLIIISRESHEPVVGVSED